MTISIIIPLYNGIEFLEECVFSVISQTFTDWEILIGINGHGSDGGNVAYQAHIIARLDPRIHIYIQPLPLNGKVKSSNDLVSKSKGDWICMLDCDDKWEPTKLEKQYEASLYITKDAVVIGTFCQYFGESRDIPTLPSGYIDPAVLEEYNPIINSSAMIKREYCLWKCDDILEDYSLWMDICLQGKKLYNIPEYLTWHRIHSKSSFNTQGYSNLPLRIQYANIRKDRMAHIDAILYINLEHRTDRKEHILHEIKKLGKSESDIYRIDAIKKEPGALGCSLSHIKALEFALEHPEWNMILILEDDFTFYGNHQNEIIHHINHVIDNYTFDVCQLSYNPKGEFSNTYDPRIKKSIRVGTSSSYLIYRSYIPKLLQNIKESSSNMEFHKKHHNNCMDVYWNVLQKKDNWICISPAIGYQYDNYSDIEKKLTCYRC